MGKKGTHGGSDTHCTAYSLTRTNTTGPSKGPKSRNKPQPPIPEGQGEAGGSPQTESTTEMRVDKSSRRHVSVVRSFVFFFFLFLFMVVVMYMLRGGAVSGAPPCLSLPHRASIVSPAPVASPALSSSLSLFSPFLPLPPCVVLCCAMRFAHPSLLSQSCPPLLPPIDRPMGLTGPLPLSPSHCLGFKPGISHTIHHAPVSHSFKHRIPSSLSPLHPSPINPSPQSLCCLSLSLGLCHLSPCACVSRAVPTRLVWRRATS